MVDRRRCHWSRLSVCITIMLSRNRLLLAVETIRIEQTIMNPTYKFIHPHVNMCILSANNQNRAPPKTYPEHFFISSIFRAISALYFNILLLSIGYCVINVVWLAAQKHITSKKPFRWYWPKTASCMFGSYYVKGKYLSYFYCIYEWSRNQYSTGVLLSYGTRLGPVSI